MSSLRALRKSQSSGSSLVSLHILRLRWSCGCDCCGQYWPQGGRKPAELPGCTGGAAPGQSCLPVGGSAYTLLTIGEQQPIYAAEVWVDAPCALPSCGLQPERYALRWVSNQASDSF